MKKIIFLGFLVISAIIINGCGTVDKKTNDSPGATQIFTSIADKIAECAPNLSSASLSDWANWAPTADNTIFNKHFSIDGGEESIYHGAFSLDNIIGGLEVAIEQMDSSGNFFVDYIMSMGSNTVNIQLSGNISDFDGNGIELPSAFGVGSITVTKKGSLFVMLSGNTMEDVEFYFDIDDNSQIIVDYVQSLNDGSESISYSKVNTAIGKIIFKKAYVGTMESMVKLEGNFIDKTSKFSLKTDSVAVFGGGSVANDNSKYAVRAQDDADNITPNDGANLTSTSGYYVIIANEDIYSASFSTTPKVVSTDLAGETEDVANYIRTDHVDSLGWTTEYLTLTDLVITVL